MDGAEEEMLGEEFAGEKDRQRQPRVDEGEGDANRSGEEAGAGDAFEGAESDLSLVAGGRPFFVADGEEGEDVDGDESEEAEGEVNGIDKEGSGSGEAEEEGGEAAAEVPVHAFGIVIDHDAGEDGGEGEGDEGEFGGGDAELDERMIRQEGRDGEDGWDGGEEGKGEDLAGEPGGFEAEKKAPGFEGLA